MADKSLRDKILMLLGILQLLFLIVVCISPFILIWSTFWLFVKILFSGLVGMFLMAFTFKIVSKVLKNKE